MSQLKNFVLVCFSFFAISTFCQAQEARIYPGAQVDNEATAMWKRSQGVMNMQTSGNSALKSAVGGMQVGFYYTLDDYEKVCDYYRREAKEFSSPEITRGAKNTSALGVRRTYFIFDQAQDLASSKSYVVVEFPRKTKLAMNVDVSRPDGVTISPVKGTEKATSIVVTIIH